MSQDVNIDEGVWSSRSHVSPLVIEGIEEVIVPYFYLEVGEESYIHVDEERLRKVMYSPSTPTHTRLK